MNYKKAFIIVCVLLSLIILVATLFFGNIYYKRMIYNDAIKDIALEQTSNKVIFFWNTTDAVGNQFCTEGFIKYYNEICDGVEQ